jgi:hypothetical protein
MRVSLARCLACFVLVSSTGCAIVNNMSGVSEARDIQRRGRQASALVLELWDTGMTLNDDPVVGLKVRVEAWGVSPYDVTIAKSLVSRVHIPQVQPGVTVPVYVDPQNPSRVALGLYDLRH